MEHGPRSRLVREAEWNWPLCKRGILKRRPPQQCLGLLIIEQETESEDLVRSYPMIE